MIVLDFFCVVFIEGLGGILNMDGGKQDLFFILDLFRIFFWNFMFFLLKQFVIWRCFMNKFLGILYLEFVMQQVKFIRQMGCGFYIIYNVLIKMSYVVQVIKLMMLNCRFFCSCYVLLGILCLVFRKVLSSRGMEKSLIRCLIKQLYFGFICFRLINCRKLERCCVGVMCREIILFDG